MEIKRNSQVVENNRYWYSCSCCWYKFSAEYREPTYNPAIQSNLGLKQHQLVIKNCQVNYWIKNSNKEKWIIFLHGAGADHRMFLEQVKVLENSYNILLIDGRGQGKSKMIDKNQSVVFSDMIDDVIQIMDITHINQTTIIAQSLGASLAQEVAFNYPDRVRKMVLIGCYNHHDKTNLLWRFRNFLMTTTFQIIPWKSLAYKFGEMTSKNKEVKDYTIDCLLNTGRETWKNLGITAYETKHEVHTYKQPHETLLIRGEYDNPEMLKEIYSKMLKVNPLAKEVVISDSGHTCNMENIADVNQAINDFLK